VTRGRLVSTAILWSAALVWSAWSSAGTFVDRDGAAHHWSITEDHALVWDGTPYLPFGGMYVARAFFSESPEALEEDRAILRLIRDQGIEDLYLNPCRLVPPPRLQEVVELLEEMGFRYGIQSCTPPSEQIDGYTIKPDHMMKRVAEAGTVAFEAGDASKALYTVVGAAAGQLLDAGKVLAKDGRFEIAVSTCPDEGALVKVVPSVQSRWIPADNATETTGYLKALRLGSGFRFFVDPIGNEYAPPRSFVPSDANWRSDFARFLEQRYTTVTKLAGAWGLAEEPPSGFDQAARLVPLLAGPADTPWPGLGYVMDDAEGKVFPVDMRASRMWADICEARETVIRDRLNALCDTIKTVCDVPVVAKRHYEATRVWINRQESGGLDGVGMESYTTGDNLAAFNAAATYAEIVQAKRPMWCLVTEYNGATWTDRHIAYKTRAEMYSDLNLLLRLGARGVFMFGLNLSATDGDKNWTIFQLVNDPRQLEWLATFARAARSRTEWLAARPNTAFWYPAQNTDAKAFTAGNLPDYGLSGAWNGKRAVLKVGPGRWAVPVYHPDVPGLLLHAPDLSEWPCLARESQALASLDTTRLTHAVSLTDSYELPAEFAQGPATPVPIRIWNPVPDVEGVAWLAADGQHHISLRSLGGEITVRLSAPGHSSVKIRRAGASDSSDESLPATVLLPAAKLSKESFLLSNASFGATNIRFECDAGHSPPPVEIRGVAPDALEITPGG
jgi:hypothetical protein